MYAHTGGQTGQKNNASGNLWAERERWMFIREKCRLTEGQSTIKAAV